MKPALTPTPSGDTAPPRAILRAPETARRTSSSAMTLTSSATLTKDSPCTSTSVLPTRTKAPSSGPTWTLFSGSTPAISPPARATMPVQLRARGGPGIDPVIDIPKPQKDMKNRAETARGPLQREGSAGLHRGQRNGVLGDGGGREAPVPLPGGRLPSERPGRTGAATATSTTRRSPKGTRLRIMGTRTGPARSGRRFSRGGPLSSGTSAAPSIHGC